MENNAFNVRQLCYYKSDKHVRVYCNEKEIWFLWLANQSFMELIFEIVNIYMLGLGFGMRKYFLKRFCSKIDLAAEKADHSFNNQGNPSRRRNYKKKLNEIKSSTIYHAKSGFGHGAPVGFWRFLLTNNKTIKLQFDKVDEMKKAIKVLPDVFGDRLKTLVKWDNEKNCFVKK